MSKKIYRKLLCSISATVKALKPYAGNDWTEREQHFIDATKEAAYDAIDTIKENGRKIEVQEAKKLERSLSNIGMNRSQSSTFQYYGTPRSDVRSHMIF